MQEKIYTIPLNESFEDKTGCPLCRLKKKLEADSVDYVLGAAMMEPDVRIQTNKRGFCRNHLSDMLGMKNRLGLSLILSTHTEEVTDKAFPKGLFSKPDCARISEALIRQTDSCFICERVKEYMKHYYDNCVYLWQTQSDFQLKMREAEYLCIPDGQALLSCGDKLLSKKDKGHFAEDVSELIRKGLESVKLDLDVFCKSFEYQNVDIPLTENQKRAAERAADVLTGEKNN